LIGATTTMVEAINRHFSADSGGKAREFQVERFFREIQIARIAPVNPQLILPHIAECVLGLPKSY
jgi:hypothetical protein